MLQLRWRTLYIKYNINDIHDIKDSTEIVTWTILTPSYVVDKKCSSRREGYKYLQIFQYLLSRFYL